MNVHLDSTRKHDALFIFDAIDSNPNGDPDNGGAPRIDIDDGTGLVSDASLKRKIRDIIELRTQIGDLSAERYRIFIRRGVSLNEQLEETYNALGLKADPKTKGDNTDKAQPYMIENYFDVRMFGAVMSTGKATAGKVTGPVTVGIARSYHPVFTNELAITRTASTQEEKRDNASQMGAKSVVPYALYAAQVHYQPNKDCPVTSDDLAVFWHALQSMFELTRSAARPDVNVRSLNVFTHENRLGNAPARSLLDRVQVTLREGLEAPRRYADYTIAVPRQEDLPPGVTLTTLV